MRHLFCMARLSKARLTAAWIITLLLYSPGAGAAPPLPTPPPQPVDGPGGSTYTHGAMTTNGPYFAAGQTRDDAMRYFLYEPAQPTPASAPVVLFLHGLGALEPSFYSGWIEHMVRKGFVVVWVQYQVKERLRTLQPPKQLTQNAAIAWQDALGRLQTGTHVRPERDGFGEMKTAAVGHSLGGFLSAAIAARAGNPLNGLPAPYAVVAVEPGGMSFFSGIDYGAILPGTKMLFAVGDDDHFVCSKTAVSLWEATGQIADEDRAFLLVKSDRRGSPAQIADHLFPTGGPTTRFPTDALDFYVTYKLSVGALRCVFEGADCSYAFGQGAPEQLDMGQWSDGVPMQPMEWVEDPSQMHPTCAGTSTRK